MYLYTCMCVCWSITVCVSMDGAVRAKTCSSLKNLEYVCVLNSWCMCERVHECCVCLVQTQAVTAIALHPDAPTMVLTASMDGTVRQWNLLTQTENYWCVKIFSFMINSEHGPLWRCASCLQPSVHCLIIVSLPFFGSFFLCLFLSLFLSSHSLQVAADTNGILVMGITNSRQMFCLTRDRLQLYNLNHFADFWATTRCSLDSLFVSGCQGKTSRVVASGRDGRWRGCDNQTRFETGGQKLNADKRLDRQETADRTITQ